MICRQAIAMSPVHCTFNHANPAGARFCNECGCMLQREPRENREAVEHHGAGNHLDSGTGFPDSTALTDATGIAGATADKTASGPSAVGGSQSVTADLASFQNGLADDSSQLSAVRINPTWCESWIAEGVARSPVLDRSVVPGTVVPEDDALHRDGGVILGQGSVWKPGRRQMIAAALLIAICVSVFYGYQETRRTAAPIDRRLPGSIATEPSGAGSLQRDAASKPISPAIDEYGERAGDAADGAAAAVDVRETVGVPTVQHSQDEIALRGEKPLASDAPTHSDTEIPATTTRTIVSPVRALGAQARTAQAKTAEAPKSAPSIDSARATEKHASRQLRVPAKARAKAPSAEPPNLAPLSPCSDQVVALGLCGTSGASAGR